MDHGQLQECRKDSDGRRNSGRACWIGMCAAIILALPLYSGAARASSFEDGLSKYRQNDMDGARKHFEDAVKESPESADAWAMLGETLRRLDRLEEAEQRARRAIEIEPCHAFAHTVLGDLYSPQYVSLKNAHFDSTWTHLRKAVSCDPSEGNAWLNMWSETLRRKETADERKVYESLVKTEFLTSTLLDYARWMLKDLPTNAILMTNGDMDTYPPLAIQSVDGFRADVGIINLSMLNLKWYARLVCDRYDLPLPFGEEGFEALNHKAHAGGGVETISDQILASWIAQAARGELRKPLALTVTVAGVQEKAGEEAQLTFCGSFYRVGRKDDEAIDVSAVQSSIASADALDFTGPFASERDMSPIRYSSADRMVANVAAAGMRLAYHYLESEHPDEAIELAAWAERIERGSRMGLAHKAQIDDIRHAAKEISEKD